MSHSNLIKFGLLALVLAALGIRSASVRSDVVYFAGTPANIAQVPLYMKDAVAPLNMLVMGKDHKIYYEAYNDASDLDGDGSIDVGYRGWQLKNPAPTDGSSAYKIDYYGYFNSYVCYNYSGDKFVPVSATSDKKCGGAYWSGDFLNYLTTSRMDALRRVLYGGWRQVDSSTDTVLQGAYFPQDAHSWGKEYESETRDGYRIADYAPVTAPDANKYNLFAVTTLKGNNNTYAAGYQAPVLRVLKNTGYRVWEWVSIEGPVAGLRCENGGSGPQCVGGGIPQAYPGHPGSSAQFDNLVATYGIASYQFGSGSLSEINCTNNDCNPFGVDANYLTLIEGTFHVGNGSGNQGYYQFAVDGDDAIDFRITETDGGLIAGGQAGYYGGHSVCNCTTYQTGAIYMDRGADYAVRFRHEEEAGGDAYVLKYRTASTTLGLALAPWQVVPGGSGNGSTGLRNLTIRTYNLAPTMGGATRDDYLVRVQACPANATLRDAVCKAYTNGPDVVYKPTGILHDYGEDQRMYFGLITGTQGNNLQGGALRRNIKDFADEIDPSTGVFRTNVNGIVNTISRLRMIGGAYNSGATHDNTNATSNWNWANGTGDCVSQGGRTQNNGECRMWGNPLAEMLYESMRYFAGAKAATPNYAPTASGPGFTEETSMGLGTEAWDDPYDPDGGFRQCAKPYQTIISDINPSYDSNVPGTAFNDGVLPNGTTPATISGFSAGAEGGAIWAEEGLGSARNVFIGEVAGSPTDYAPTAKSVSSFGNIRGLSPEEPSKQGTYYSASVARFARNTDVNPRAEEQKISTYSIALASPLPRIEFPVGNGKVTLIPFAKTASGTFGGATRKPTNTIVDFYVQQINNLPGGVSSPLVNGGRPYAVFRINYEDVEQGNDHDMDAIVRYEVIANANNTVTVNLTSEYAAGSANQNIGYVMSGTTQDGVYLEVRDTDSPNTSFPYALNTPPGRSPGFCSGNVTTECGLLPFVATRTFTLSSSATAVQLKDPLWYAAKYGAPKFGELTVEGDPVNYFLVTNPLNLRNQLSRAFDDIANRDLDVGAASISGARVGNASFSLQPVFSRGRNGKDWTGNVTAVGVNRDGTLSSTTLWDARASLPAPGVRNILAVTTPGTSSAITARSFVAGNLNFGMLGFNALTVNSVYGANYSLDDLVRYLRGDQSREASQGGASNTLRTRSSVLGDIVNSEPVIASNRSNFGYGYYSDPMFSGYTGVGGYLETKLTRKTVAYVGANDGMLHAFDATTRPCANPLQTCAEVGAGRELFAVVPNGVLSNMAELPKPDDKFTHKYFVDGQITVTDAKQGGNWKTLLAASTGGGGNGSVFALDISNPTAFGNAGVLWERNHAIDDDIGNVYGKPLIVPLENGQWGVLFGNGYGGERSDPSLYVLDAFTGQPIQKLVGNDGNVARTLLGLVDCDFLGLGQLLGCKARSGAPYNGLGQITAIDKDSNGKVDTVYGGDLQGNLWKFDLRDANAGNWEVANGNKPLFRTQRTTNESGQNQYQPITGGIRVSSGPGTGAMVYFGTGRYFATGDNNVSSTPQLQSFYGFFDNFTDTGAIATISNLQVQTASAGTGLNGYTTRNISNDPVFYYGPSAKRGWYLDLKLQGATNGNGERFIATPLIQSGRVFFTTFTPEQDSCDPGGLNFQYGLDLLSGNGRIGNVELLGRTSGDGNNDGVADNVACTGSNCGAAAVTGRNGEMSIAPITGIGVSAINPTVQIDPACDPTVSSCATFEQCKVVVYPSMFALDRACGRQSWRQLK